MDLSFRERTAGAALVVAGVLFQSLWLGRAAALLSVALVLAYVVWAGGAWSSRHPWLGATYRVGLLVFVLHASEEYLQGFHRRLPALAGAARWTDLQFLAFNAVWFAIFVIAAWAMQRRRPLGVLVVLFFALAGGVGNGIGHLLLALGQGGYFPGAWTAPLCLLVGGLLLRQLFHSGRWGPAVGARPP